MFVFSGKVYFMELEPIRIIKTIDMKNALYFLLFLLVSPVAMFAQQQTITVTGSYEYNLSPDEVIVGVSYQEYFYTDGEEMKKMAIEEVEAQVVRAIYKAGIKEDKVTLGDARIIRPYVNGSYQKRRIEKSLYVCVLTTQEFLDLTRSLEAADLFDRMVTAFDIQEYRHTERESYMTKSRAKAFEDAKEKAQVILQSSGQKVGKALQVRELDTARSPSFDPSFYQVLEVEETPVSGFRPVVIACKVEVVFELL